MDQPVLLALAVAFALVNGVNDGGALVATGLSLRALRTPLAVALLAGAVVLAPLVLGVAVARTLSEDLVGFAGSGGQAALVAAIVATLAVVWGLTYRGLPTSLTLALVGALTGAGFGAGLTVAWRTLWWVLFLAAAAPVVSALIAVVLGRAARWLPDSGPAARRLAMAHRVAFGLQCLAYGVNDGQKMLAVLAVAVGMSAGDVTSEVWPLLVVAAAFAVGTVVGVRRVGGIVGGELLPMRPFRAVVTELASATAVISTGLVGAPVSMTQSVIGGQVGTGVTVGTGRVRWRAAGRVGAAWVSTLPLAFALGALLAAGGTRW